MTDLQRRSLARLALSASNVELLFDAARHPLDGDRTPVLKIICDLCESHERLRMELEGSAVMVDDGERRVTTLAAQLNTALDAGLAHADTIAKWRDGLLRIFARSPDWSGECVQANVADLLGMSMKEVQDEIDRTTPPET